MSEHRLIELVRFLANGGLSMALCFGGALLARRSIAAGAYLALAGFFEAGAGTFLPMIQRQIVIPYGGGFALVTLGFLAHAVGELGFVALAVHALARSPRTR